jgi:iron complex transport system permease protein
MMLEQTLSPASTHTTRVSTEAKIGIVLIILWFVLFIASLAVGRAPIAALKTLVAALTGALNDVNSPDALILLQLRLPRALLASLVGASLGIAGAALQGLLRNALAEPGVIGVSACAALGSVLAFYTGLSSAYALALPLGGLIGAALSVMLLYVIAGHSASTLTLILAGVALNSFAGALTALALNLAPSPYAAFEIMFWLLGSVADRSLEHVAMAAPLMLIGWALILTTGRALDALTLGEDVAHSLGFNLKRVRLRLVLGVAACVGAGVAFTGAIGFVGLVVPHLLRSFVGGLPSRLLILSAIGGAVLTLTADLAVRLIERGVELKLGVVTALIGAPFLCVLVLQARRKEI